MWQHPGELELLKRYCGGQPINVNRKSQNKLKALIASFHLSLEAIQNQGKSTYKCDCGGQPNTVD